MSLDNGVPQSRRAIRELESRRTPAAVRTVVVRRPAPKKRKNFASTLLSFGAMLFAGALLVGVSIPANAFMADADQVTTAKLTAVEGQSVSVSADIASADATRAGFTGRISYVIAKNGKIAAVHNDPKWEEHVSTSLAAVKALK